MRRRPFFLQSGQGACIRYSVVILAQRAIGFSQGFQSLERRVELEFPFLSSSCPQGMKKKGNSHLT
jgi:hypothetical protein